MARTGSTRSIRGARWLACAVVLAGLVALPTLPSSARAPTATPSSVPWPDGPPLWGGSLSADVHIDYSSVPGPWSETSSSRDFTISWTNVAPRDQDLDPGVYDGDGTGSDTSAGSTTCSNPQYPRLETTTTLSLTGGRLPGLDIRAGAAEGDPLWVRLEMVPASAGTSTDSGCGIVEPVVEDASEWLGFSLTGNYDGVSRACVEFPIPRNPDDDFNHYRGTTPLSVDCSNPDMDTSYVATGTITYDLHRVASGPCVAAFTTKPDTTVGNGNVAFDPTGSSPPTKGQYTWDFGDGPPVVKTSDATFTHHFAATGEHLVSLTVSDGLCEAAKDEQTITSDPVAAYAPTVVMHPDERYFPASATTFIHHSSLEYWPEAARFGSARRPSSCQPTRIAGFGVVHPALLSGSGGSVYFARRKKPPNALGRCNWRDTRLHANDPAALKKSHHKGAFPYWDANDGIVLNPSDDAATRVGNPPDGSDRINAPMYTESFSNGRGRGALIYWFFYPFNGWKGNINAAPDLATEFHEGDWEHIVVRLDVNSVAEQVAYFQHYCSGQAFGRDQTAFDSAAPAAEWHPMVWAAKGGHASYATNIGVNTDGSCPDDQALQGTGDETGAGPRWVPWRSPLAQLANAKKQPWYGFRGAWGDRVRSTFSNYGPWGPGPARAVQSDTMPSGWIPQA